MLYSTNCQDIRAMSSFSGVLIDLRSKAQQPVSGNFHLCDQWWQLIILRTRKNKEKKLEPVDPMATCYRLRDDHEQMKKDGVVHMFLSKLSDAINKQNPREENWFAVEKERFYKYLR